MIARQAMLVRRELWEHRSLLVTPAVIALLVSLMAVTGHVTISTFGSYVDVAIIGASNLGAPERSAAINIMLIGISSLFALAMSVLMLFYTLDALYAERKDRSILFWRSIPCSDAETVLSKLAVAIVVIPLLTMAAVVVTHLVVLAATGIWVEARGANAWHLIWSVSPLVDNWVATLVVFLALPLWQAPFLGWFLFVSAFTRRSPFAVALLPILILPMLEKTLLGSTLLAQAIFVRSANLPLFRGLRTDELFFYEGRETAAEGARLALLPLLDLPRFLGSPSLWLGLIVCCLFTAAAIYVRRYRDDS